MKKILIVLTAMLIMLTAAYAVLACCYTNKDVHQFSAFPAYDLKIVLQGTRVVEEHYDGEPDGWYFNKFNVTYEGGNTILHWDSTSFDSVPMPIPFCEYVHIGYWLDAPARVLMACWTDQFGNCLPDGIFRQVGHDVIWTFPSNEQQIALRIFNDTSDPSTISNVSYVIYPSEIPLADLNADNATLMADLQSLPGGPYVIPPGGMQEIIIPGEVEVGQALVYRFEGEEFVDFGQHEMEAPIPTLNQWGLIILMIFILGAAAIIIRRRTVRA